MSAPTERDVVGNLVAAIDACSCGDPVCDRCWLEHEAIGEIAALRAVGHPWEGDAA